MRSTLIPAALASVALVTLTSCGEQATQPSGALAEPGAAVEAISATRPGKPAGPPLSNWTMVSHDTGVFRSTSNPTITVHCPAGMKVLGGGYEDLLPTAVKFVWASRPTDSGDGWQITVDVVSTRLDHHWRVFATCARAP